MEFNDISTTFTKDNTNLLDMKLSDEYYLPNLREIYHVYNSAIMEVRTKIEVLDSEFRLKYDHDPIHHIEYRLKSPASIKKKLEKYHITEPTEEIIRNKVRDLAGIRIICGYIEDIYLIADLLISQNDITLLRLKDYIKEPKESGYRSLHLLISVPVFFSSKTEYVTVELQIRTIAMDFWASLEHHLKYKANFKVPGELMEELSDCALSISELDQKMQSIKRKIEKYEFSVIDTDQS